MNLRVVEATPTGWKTTHSFDVPPEKVDEVRGAIIKARDCTLPHKCAFPFKKCNAQPGAIIVEE